MATDIDKMQMMRTLRVVDGQEADGFSHLCRQHMRMLAAHCGLKTGKVINVRQINYSGFESH